MIVDPVECMTKGDIILLGDSFPIKETKWQKITSAQNEADCWLESGVRALSFRGGGL